MEENQSPKKMPRAGRPLRHPASLIPQNRDVAPKGTEQPPPPAFLTLSLGQTPLCRLSTRGEPSKRQAPPDTGMPRGAGTHLAGAPVGLSHGLPRARGIQRSQLLCQGKRAHNNFWPCACVKLLCTSLLLLLPPIIFTTRDGPPSCRKEGAEERRAMMPADCQATGDLASNFP